MDTNDILLSPESYNLLKYISSHPEFSPVENSEYSIDCLNQLLHCKLVVCAHTYIDFNSGFPTDSTYSITELGKGYLYGRQSNEEFQQSLKNIASSAQEHAETAKEQTLLSKDAAEQAARDSEAANKQAHDAKIISIIAIIAPLVYNALIDNWGSICKLFESLSSK